MDEIEKLYKSVGVEKFCNSDSEFCPVAFCSECIFSIYPSFTTEKQLELIKWLAHRADNGLLINKHITDGGASMVFDDLGHKSTLASSFIGFEECLASLINNLWQDLTDTEKEQVRGILEG